MSSLDLLAFGPSVDNRKNAIDNLLASYPLAWIVIHETLQNSIDAIQKSGKAEGSISILMDLDKEEIEITDNGRGFPYKFDLLLYGGTDKLKDPQGNLLGGNIGVGLKVVLFSSKDFKIESINNNQTWKLKVSDAYKYEQLDKLTPQIDEPKPSIAESGTKITYSFPDRKVSDFIEYVFKEFFYSVEDKLASDHLNKFKMALEFYLRSYSYAGNLDRLLGRGKQKKTIITIKIACTQAPKRATLSDPNLRGILAQNSPVTITFENKHWDVQEAITRTLPGYPKPQPIVQDLPTGGGNSHDKDQIMFMSKNFLPKTKF